MFNIDIIADEEALTPFEFKMGGKVWRAPHIADLTIRQQIALDSGHMHSVMREVAEVQDGDKWAPAGDAAASLILDMRPGRIGKISAAWLLQAGHASWESVASPS